MPPFSLIEHRHTEKEGVTAFCGASVHGGKYSEVGGGSSPLVLFLCWDKVCGETNECF